MTPRSSTEQNLDRAAMSAALPSGLSNDLPASACRHCQTRNEGERKFCRECGAPLYGPCPECGETTGLSEKFCGGCGFHLGEVFEQRLRSSQAVLAEGSALRAAAQFVQAQLVLRRLAVDPDPLLHALRRRAERELQLCEADLKGAVQRREQLIVEAQQAFDQSAYERAVALLDEIPEGVRNEEVQKLGGRARAFREECDQLLKSIREAVAAKEYVGLLAQVERLLVLKPNHQQAQAMLGKLRVLEHQGQSQRRDRYLEAAKRKLAECKYDEAAALLADIRPEVRTPDIERTQEFARETAWLSQQLRGSLIATDALVRLGERLLKLQPADRDAAKVIEKLRKSRGAAAAFAAPIRAVPGGPYLGCPVEYPPRWKALKMEPGIAAAVAPRQAQFFAAAGFALEGLGKAALTPKFEIDAGGGLWKKLGRAVRKRDSRTAWGIDIGESSLKAIRLRLRDDGQVVADAAEYLTHERPLSDPGVDALATLRESWRRLCSAQDLSEGRLCGGFSSQSLLSRTFKLPPVEDKQIPAIVKYEAAMQIPVALDQVAWDFHVFGTKSPARRYELEAALFAAKKSLLTERLAQWEALEVRLDVLQADCVGVYNTLAFEGLLPAPDEGESGSQADEEVTMALDIGANATIAMVGHVYSVWTRVLPGGGGEFTRALVKELTLTARDAERLKRQPFAATAAHKVDAALQTPLQSFAAELQRTMTYYVTHQRRRRIGRILLLGGGARLHGLYDALWRGVG